MKNQFLVINYDDVNDYFIVDDLETLKNEMYDVEMVFGELEEQINERFKNAYKVFEIEGEIKELN